MSSQHGMLGNHSFPQSLSQLGSIPYMFLGSMFTELPLNSRSIAQGILELGCEENVLESEFLSHCSWDS